jgi:hypothetical protein
LTSSLYVPGTLADKENVIVDVGTGFYVEKVCSCFLWNWGRPRLMIEEYERCDEVLRGEG